MQITGGQTNPVRAPYPNKRRKSVVPQQKFSGGIKPLDKYKPAELYKDLLTQAKLCALISTDVRQSAYNRINTPMVWDDDVREYVIPIAIDDVEVAISHDTWKGMEWDNPQADWHSSLHKQLTMYFAIDGDGDVDVEANEEKRKKLQSEVRIDPGRLIAYERFIENNDSKDSNGKWEQNEKDRRGAKRVKLYEATVSRIKNALKVYKEHEKKVYEGTQGSTPGGWSREFDARRKEFELETARDAQTQRLLSKLRNAGQESGWTVENETAALELVNKLTEMYTAPLPIENIADDPPFTRDEKYVAEVGSLVGKLNEGHSPTYDMNVHGQQEDYRNFLRRHLYKFGLSYDFFYQTKDYPYPSNGIVVFSWNGLMQQDRKLGDTLEGPGTFLKRCNIKDLNLDRNGQTKRPVLHTGHTDKTCPNWVKYTRANRYRMEVARLWYKLFHYQEPEIISRLMYEAQVTTTTDTLSNHEHSGNRPVVLSVIEYGDKGALRLPTILPKYKIVEQSDSVNSEMYEIEDAEKYEMTLKCDKHGAEPVQSRGDYTWPIQKIGNTREWLKFAHDIKSFNRISIAVLDAIFKEDITTSFDWYDGSLPEKVRDIFTTSGTVADENQVWYEMEAIFDGIIGAIPIWAQAFLSINLVNDEWLTSSDSLISNDQSNLEFVKENVKKAEKGLYLKETALARAEKLGQEGLIHVAQGGLDAARTLLWVELTRMHELVRDASPASFVWRAYASDAPLWRANEDKEQDEGTSTTWSKTQLHRCVIDIDTRRVEESGFTHAPPDHQPLRYMIGPRLTPRGLATAKRGMDLRTLEAGSVSAHLFYATWYIDKVAGKGMGNKGQIVTLQDMFTYLNHPENPQYIQTQGQWGVVESVKVNDTGLKDKFSIRVISYQFTEFNDSDIEAGKCDKDGNPLLVDVSAECVWPLSYDNDYRYGDVVAPKIIEKWPAEKKEEMMPVRFAVIQYLWNQYTESSSKYKLVRWKKQHNEVVYDNVPYRNIHALVFYAPEETPEGMMRRPRNTFEYPPGLNKLWKALNAKSDPPPRVDPKLLSTVRVNIQLGKLVHNDQHQWYDMDYFQTGHP